MGNIANLQFFFEQNCMTWQQIKNELQHVYGEKAHLVVAYNVGFNEFKMDGFL
jgi:hypothetical protein